MSSYEELKRLFNKSKYAPTKFICKACENVVYWRDLYCSECDRMIEWCCVEKEYKSFIVKL